MNALKKEAARPPEDERSDRAAEELSKLVGLDARSESLAEETAAEISKAREKSENVVENKASAGQALRASGKQSPTGIQDLQGGGEHEAAILVHRTGGVVGGNGAIGLEPSADFPGGTAIADNPRNSPQKVRLSGTGD
jgi:hypothetical protein